MITLGMYVTDTTTNQSFTVAYFAEKNGERIVSDGVSWAYVRAVVPNTSGVTLREKVPSTATHDPWGR